MRADSQSLSVTLTFANPRAAAEFFLRPLCARGSFAAQAAMAQIDRGETPNWEAANAAAFERQAATAAAFERQAATAVVAQDLRPEPETFRTYGLELAQDLGVVFGRGRSEMILRGVEVTVAPRGLWESSDPEDVADAIAGRLLGGLAPWAQTPERKALARKILALWAKDRKDRAAEKARAAEEERLARRSGVTVAEYRARLAKAARRSGRAGAGGKPSWTVRRAVAA